MLTKEDIKVGRFYRAKKPRLVGNIFFHEVNDRQVVWMSEFTQHIKNVRLGYNPLFLEWAEKKRETARERRPWRCWDHGFLDRESQQQFETETGQDAEMWKELRDYVVQYDGPSVKIGSFRPKVWLKDFLKWAGSDVTDILPEGEWAKELPIKENKKKKQHAD